MNQFLKRRERQISKANFNFQKSTLQCRICLFVSGAEKQESNSFQVHQSVEKSQVDRAIASVKMVLDNLQFLEPSCMQRAWVGLPLGDRLLGE